MAPLVDVALLGKLAEWSPISTLRCFVRLRDLTGCQTRPLEVPEVVAMAPQGAVVGGILANTGNT